MGRALLALPVVKETQMSTRGKVCCSSRASICYWFAASLVAWGLLSLVVLYWRPVGAASASTILLAAGVGCVANWLRNRTLHCGITAPLLLLAGILFLLSDVGLLHVAHRFVWPPLASGVGIAFLLEWRYARRLKRNKPRRSLVRKVKYHRARCD